MTFSCSQLKLSLASSSTTTASLIHWRLEPWLAVLQAISSSCLHLGNINIYMDSAYDMLASQFPDHIAIINPQSPTLTGSLLLPGIFVLFPKSVLHISLSNLYYHPISDLSTSPTSLSPNASNFFSKKEEESWQNCLYFLVPFLLVQRKLCPFWVCSDFLHLSLLGTLCVYWLLPMSSETCINCSILKIPKHQKP